LPPSPALPPQERGEGVSCLPTSRMRSRRAAWWRAESAFHWVGNVFHPPDEPLVPVERRAVVAARERLAFARENGGPRCQAPSPDRRGDDLDLADGSTVEGPAQRVRAMAVGLPALLALVRQRGARAAVRGARAGARWGGLSHRRDHRARASGRERGA